MICPYCRSYNIVKQGKKKHKCLDCFKSFKHGYVSNDSNPEDAHRQVVALLRIATGINLMRDFSNDSKNYKEQDIVKED